MGFSIKKAFKKVVKVASFGAYRGGSGGGGAVEAPTPAPELELTNQEGEAEQPRPARHEFARDEPEGDEARQTVVVE